MADNKYECTRCTKSYIYKSGLTAHIRRKHPLPAQPKKNTKVIKPQAPRVTAQNVPAPEPVVQANHLDTQEIDNLLDDKDEFYNAVEELEHNVGINESMVNWYGVNFQSSFSNTGEFAQRTAPMIQPISNCEECKVSAITFEKQRDLLMKQDKTIQESHHLQKKDKEEKRKKKANHKD